METSILELRDSVSEVKGQDELERSQQVIHLDIEANSDAIGALQGRIDHIADSFKTTGTIQPQREYYSAWRHRGQKRNSHKHEEESHRHFQQKCEM